MPARQAECNYREANSILAMLLVAGRLSQMTIDIWDIHHFNCFGRRYVDGRQNICIFMQDRHSAGVEQQGAVCGEEQRAD